MGPGVHIARRILIHLFMFQFFFSISIRHANALVDVNELIEHKILNILKIGKSCC